MQPFLGGIWAAVHTPFHADGALDLDGVAANAAQYAGPLGLAGIFVNGGMGEHTSLSAGERKAALQAHIAGGGAGWRVGTVVTQYSLPDTLELARHAGQAGADHIVLMRPSGGLTDDELGDYAETVIAAAGLPGILFDRALAPGGWPVPVILRLARTGAIRAVKCTRDPDANGVLRAACGDAVLVTNPFESQCLSMLARWGLDSLYADPEPYLFQRPGHRPIAAYHTAWRDGDVATAMAVFQSLEPMRAVYERWITGPLRQGRPVNAALKRWAGRMGLATGPVRHPLRPLPPDVATALDADLDRAGVIAVGLPGL
jgi:4-hydroxy-tetrahydrodipicolinate synthase